MTSISEIQKFLKNDIAAVNKIIFSYLNDNDELIQLISDHLINSGGKRIRPMLTILTSRMFNYRGIDYIKLAVAVEFIHVATLLHDDVVDNSSMRRFKPTANFIWGNKASILVGDYILSQAFKLLIEVGLISTLKSVSNATSLLIKGEVKQLQALNDAEIIMKEKYDKIIIAKTAELFGSACEIGAIIANQDDHTTKALYNYGIILGKIFQIIDDLLDYLGNSELIGKNIGDDFFEGKITLPIILLYEKLSKKEQIKVEALFKLSERSQEQFEEIQSLLQKHKIKYIILQNVEKLKEKALDVINLIKVDNEICKNYLIFLIDFSVNRSY